MYSTKRKIHNILHNATSRNASSTSLPLQQTPNASSTTLSSTLDEDARKRRRIVAEAANPAGIPSVKTSPRPIKVDAATYAPWDREQFLKRISTYRSVSNWSMKPEGVNEVAWAKRGWVCVAGQKDRVRCTSHCGGEVVVKIEVGEDDANLDDIESAVVEEKEKIEALVNKYEELIVEGHEDDCLWKKRGCDPAIYRLPLQPPVVSRADFYARSNSLSTFPKTSLPSNLAIPAELNVESFVLPAEISDTLSREVASLAVLGWTREDTAGAVEMVKCNACFRRLGLWLFNKAPSNADATDDDDDISSMGRLDIVQEHRDYCPWINATSQTGTKPGWQVLAKVLQNPIPGNLVAAATPSRPHTPVSHEPKTEEQYRADDESRWKRLKSLRKVYGPNFGMKALAGKVGEKGKKDGANEGASPGV